MWLRCRFEANLEDPRPVEFPPPGPYWITGYGDDYSTVVAYVREREQVREYWPEAEHISQQQQEEIVFTERFAEPEWWDSQESDNE